MNDPVHEVPVTPDNDWNWGAVRFEGKTAPVPTPDVRTSDVEEEGSLRPVSDTRPVPVVALEPHVVPTFDFDALVGGLARPSADVASERRLYEQPVDVPAATSQAEAMSREPTPCEPAPFHATPIEPASAEPRALVDSALVIPTLVDATPVDPTPVLETPALRGAGIVEVLHEAIRRGASDVHVNAGSPPMLRIDGDLAPGVTAPESWPAATIDEQLLGLLSPRQRDTFERTSELDFTSTTESGHRFRTNFFRQQGNIGAAFRHVPNEIRSLRDLGLADSIARLAHLPRGLVLVTGPTGSGKSTTLAALIDQVNESRAGHIVTIEDPIEFVHTRKRSIIDQREVGQDTDSFAVALRQVLRQDPDVILVGEMRDLETISVALTAAETGHLVFATLHTQTASTTIDRILDVFPAHQQSQVRSQLANSLRAVVSQSLLPRAGGAGRAVATEVLLTTAAVANLIREGKTFQIPTAIQSGGSIGMQSLDQALAQLVNDGVVTIAEAEAKVIDQESFSRLLKPGAAHQVARVAYGFDR